MMIWFDIDETLLDQRRAETFAAQSFLREFGPLLGKEYTVAELGRYWRSLRERHSPAYFAGKISFQERRRRRIRELFPDGAALSDRQADERFQVFFEVYRQHWSLFPDVLPCLRRLQHLRLGVLSNGKRAQQVEKLERTGIDRCFEAIVTSEQLGCAKPDPLLFQSACAEAGVETSSAVYVGDRLDNDARAACRAGLRGVWLDRRNVGGADIEVVCELTQFSELVAGRARLPTAPPAAITSNEE